MVPSPPMHWFLPLRLLLANPTCLAGLTLPKTRQSCQDKKKINVPYSLKCKWLIDQMSGVVTVQYGYFCASGIKSGWLRLEEQGRVSYMWIWIVDEGV